MSRRCHCLLAELGPSDQAHQTALMPIRPAADHRRRGPLVLGPIARVGAAARTDVTQTKWTNAWGNGEGGMVPHGVCKPFCDLGHLRPPLAAMSPCTASSPYPLQPPCNRPVAAMRPRTSSSLPPPLHPPVAAMKPRTSSLLHDSCTSTSRAMVTRRGQSAEGIGIATAAIPHGCMEGAQHRCHSAWIHGRGTAPLPFRMDAWKASTVEVSHSPL